MTRKPIFGVVGGTKKVDQPTLDLADRLGKEITARKLILLTGGKPTAKPSAVKDAAMKGAVSHASAENVARVIGILPKKPKSDLQIIGICLKYNESEHTRRLFVHTRLSSDQRNVINGFTPDVLIALKGGPGTLSEIAFALCAETPVVFLDSLTQLREVLEREIAELQGKFGKAKDRYTNLDYDRIMKGIKQFIRSEASKNNSASDIGLAIDKGLALIPTSSSEYLLKNKYPELREYTPAKQDFDEYLLKLSM